MEAWKGVKRYSTAYVCIRYPGHKSSLTFYLQRQCHADVRAYTSPTACMYISTSVSKSIRLKTMEEKGKLRKQMQAAKLSAAL